jgi:uncharacterized membrane protein YphA (DoxX/SURF4 family)
MDEVRKNIMKVKAPFRQKLMTGCVCVLRIAIGCLLIWSSIPKIRHPYVFLSNVYEYELLGSKLGMVLAMILPWLELFLGICLVGGILVGGALLGSCVVFSMFTFAHASVLYRGLEISCGCFSSSSSEVVSYATLIRSIALLLTCIAAYPLGGEDTAKCQRHYR